MRKPIRILQFPGAMLFGGVGSVVMNLYRNINREKVQFDFVVHTEEKMDCVQVISLRIQNPMKNVNTKIIF